MDQRDQIIKCMVRGLNDKEIARELDLSLKTVEYRESRIYRDFGARKKEELIIIHYQLRLKLIQRYYELAYITRPKCLNLDGTGCRAPHSCCSPEYCQMAKEVARQFWDTDLTECEQENQLPFMGKHGCVIPPHFRPLCTRHLCSINSMGADPDPELTERYFRLVDEITALEATLFGEGLGS